MSEIKPEKKVAVRTVAIALGIICIILAVGLVGAVADYTAMINGKNNDISTLTNQNNLLTNQTNQLRTWLSDNETLYTAQNMYLQNQINYLYNITSLKNNITLQIGTGYVESLSKETVGLAQAPYSGFYAGYMSYWIKTPIANSITLTVTSTSPSGIIIYNQTVLIGTSGRMLFPVLRSNVTIILETSEPAVQIYYSEQLNLYY